MVTGGGGGASSSLLQAKAKPAITKKIPKFFITKL
jgi:hypothetical protein